MNNNNTRKTISIDINTPTSIQDEVGTDRQPKNTSGRQGQSSSQAGTQGGDLQNSKVFGDMSRKSSQHIKPSALQQEAMRQAAATLQDSGTTEVKEKKRPRKRYYNGYGKVPFKVEPIQKEERKKVSRIFTEKFGSFRGTELRGGSSYNTSRQLDSKNYPCYSFGLDQRHSSEMGNKIQIHKNHVTLNPDLAVKLAQANAVIGLTNPLEEVQTLSNQGPTTNAESENTLQFTLDQYAWAHRQNLYEHKDSIGDSLGKRVHSQNAYQIRVQTAQNRKLSKKWAVVQSEKDFMMQEAAVSHLMYRADNLPKIKFKLQTPEDIYETAKAKSVNLQTRNSIPISKLQSLVPPSHTGLMSPIGKYLMQDEDEKINNDSASVMIQDNDVSVQKIPQPPAMASQVMRPIKSVQPYRPPHQVDTMITEDQNRLSNQLIQVLNQAENAPQRNKSVSIIQQRKLSPKKSKYQYKVKRNEIQENELCLSTGNIYHETKNPAMAKFINQVQGHIQESHANRHSMKESAGRVFELMSKSKTMFTRTLLEGEELGHVQGIKDRMDPNLKYQNQLRTQRFNQKQEDRYEQIRAMKPVREARKLAAQKKRIQEKIYRIEQLKKVVPELKQPQKGHYHEDGELHESSSNDSHNHLGGQEQILFAKNSLPETQNVTVRQSEMQVGESELNISNTLDLSPDKLGSEIDQEEMEEDSLDNTQSDMNTPQNNIFGNQYQMKKQLTKATGSMIKSLYEQKLKKSNARMKKMQQQLNKKVKMIKDQLGLKSISSESSNNIFQILKQKKESSPLYLLLKYFEDETFQSFKQTHTKVVGQAQKKNPIFTDTKQLGLEDRQDFNNYFVTLCDEKLAHNPKIERNKYREFLQDRYSKVVGEKILLFLENKFQTLFTFDKKGYNNVIMEFLNTGPELYKKMLFSILSFGNVGEICEHDIFQLFQSFKQRDSYYFYKQLVTQNIVPRDFKNANDDSDEIFFEAFASDVKQIARAILLRKRILGIEDSDSTKSHIQDITREQYPSQELFEEDLVNQIDYIVGVVIKRSGASAQQDIADILINGTDLIQTRNDLLTFINENQVMTKITKQSSLLARDSKISSTVVIEKKQLPRNPCLGPNIETKDGKKIKTECCFLTYEDFNKLVIFQKGRISSFVEDLVDHMTNGLISVHDIELQLSKMREPTAQKLPDPFKNKSLLEFIAHNNLKQYGDSRGRPPLQAQVKKTKRGQNKDQLKHVISTPYTTQDQYNGDEFIGKILIRKIFVQNQEELPPKEDLTVQKKGSQPLEVIAEDDSPTKSNMQLQTVLITDSQVIELIQYRQFFGGPNFFKVFRIFYKLANIPDDAQNNPFTLFLDLNSILRNFKKVFEIDNEEVAYRFASLFVAPLGQPKLFKFDILRFFFVAKNLCDNDPQSSKTYMELAFRFMDYDDNGNIGSVDILNLKRSLNRETLEELSAVFYQISIKKQLQLKMKKFQQNILDRQFNQQQEKLKKKNPMAELLKKVEKAPNVVARKPSSEDVSIDDTEQSPKECNIKEEEEMISPNEKVIRDPWNQMQIEIQQLRDYYVNFAVKTNDPNVDYEFLTLKKYELEFLHQMDEKFDIKSPTVVLFFKKHFVHDICFPPLPEQYSKTLNGNLYTGFYKKGKQMTEPPVSQELVVMQKCLDSLSTNPKMSFSMD